ncbi:major capsid hexamer protein [Microbacterium phage Cece]|nr:major capsid hexamer protein [Microbacterium phage Cece]
MDHIKTQLDNLAELNDEQIVALEASIVAKFDEFAEADLTPDTVDAMSEAADMLDSVRQEVVRREALAEELSARAAEAANRVHGKAEEEEAPAEEAPESDEPAEKDDEDEVPVTASAEGDEVETTSETPEEISETEASVEEPVVEETVAEPAPEAAEASVEEETAAEASVEEPEVEVVEPEAEAAVEEVIVETTPVEAEAAVEETVAEVEAPAEAEASVSEETTIEPEAQEEAHTVTASAEESVTPPADRAVDLQVTEAPVAIVAGADIPGISAGSTLSDMGSVAKAMVERLHTIRRANGGDGEQHTVASLQTAYTEDRALVAGAAEDNGKKIAAALDSQKALVASGGFGTPTPQTYEIFGFGTDARPVKDSLPKMGADRGSISYIEPPQLADYAGAVGVWTPDMDEAAAANGGSGADVVKNVLVVKGAQTRYAELDAITLQLQIGNLLSRAYPELVQRHNELALIQHARLAEKTILAKIGAGSTAVTSGQQLGVARDFLVTVRKAATQYRSRHRLPLETPLQAIIPNWLFEAIASDLTLQMPGEDKLGVTNGEIRGYLAGSNVTFTASYDLNEFGTQAAGPLNSWDANGTGDVTFDWFLFSQGTWVFLDGGSLDIGLVRDSALVGTNDYRMFVETFEGVAKIGIESLKVTQTFKVSGAASALEDIN